MEQAEAGFVGGVQVVDGEQQSVAASGESDQFGGGDEQPLVSGPACPRGIVTAQDAVDLLAVGVGKAVEQRRVAAAHVGERLDHRGERPGSFDRRCRAVTDAPPPSLGERSRLAQHGGLPDPGGSGDDDRAGPAVSCLAEQALDRGQFVVAADQLGGG